MRCWCAEGMANQQSAAAYAAAVSGLYQKKVTLKRDDMLLVRWATKETSENGNINLEGITSDLGLLSGNPRLFNDRDKSVILPE